MRDNGRLMRGRARDVAVVGAVSLVLRLAWVAWAHPAPTSDFSWYFSVARRFAASGRYELADGQPTAFWPPGWPFLLGGAMRGLGAQLWVGLVLQAVLASLLAMVLYLLAFRVLGGRAGAWASVLAWWVLPETWAWGSQLGTEEVFTLLLLSALLLWSGRDQGGAWWLVGCSLCVGAATLVRPQALVLVPAFAIIELCRRRGWRTALVRSGCVLGGVVLVVAPWTARNMVVMGGFVPLSTNMGQNLWQGLHSDTGFFWSDDPALNPLLGKGELDQDTAGRRAFWESLRADPMHTVVHAPLKIAALFYSAHTAALYLAPSTGPHGQAFELLATTVWRVWALIALGGIGLALLAWRRGSPNTLLLELGLIVAAYLLPFAVVEGGDRFREPLTPLLAVFVASAVLRVLHARTTPVRDLSRSLALR